MSSQAGEWAEFILLFTFKNMKFKLIWHAKALKELLMIGITVHLEEGAPMGTSLLTNHFNCMGVAVPRGMAMEVIKNKLCSWTICSIPLIGASTANRPWTRSESFSTNPNEVIPFFSSSPDGDQRSWATIPAEQLKEHYSKT